MHIAFECLGSTYIDKFKKLQLHRHPTNYLIKTLSHIDS
jgi:hypothetical protein